MTAIADAELQRLFAAAINEQQLTQGIVNTAHDAFCAALNERLEAADRLAYALYEYNRTEMGHSDGEWNQLMAAFAAYRQSKERP